MTTRSRYDRDKEDRAEKRGATTRENIALYGKAAPDVDTKRAVKQAQEDAAFNSMNQRLKSEGKPTIERGGRKSSLKDLRQDPNKTTEQLRDEKTRAGVFGKGAQQKLNVSDRVALFEDMKKGGDTAEFRKRATELGVDQKGWDIAQARLAKDKPREQTEEEAEAFGRDKPAATPEGLPESQGKTPAGKKDIFQTGNDDYGDTSGNFIADFDNEARKMGEEFTALDSEKERLATNKSLDERMAADAAAVDAARNKRLLDARKGEINIASLEQKVDDARGVAAINKIGIDDRSNRASARLADRQAEADSRTTYTQDAVGAVKAVAGLIPKAGIKLAESIEGKAYEGGKSAAEIQSTADARIKGREDSAALKDISANQTMQKPNEITNKILSDKNKLREISAKQTMQKPEDEEERKRLAAR